LKRGNLSISRSVLGHNAAARVEPGRLILVGSRRGDIARETSFLEEAHEVLTNSFSERGLGDEEEKKNEKVFDHVVFVEI
jgi:hypothetical protein